MIVLSCPVFARPPSIKSLVVIGVWCHAPAHQSYRTALHCFRCFSFDARDTDYRCERVARALRAGIVWQNCSQPAFVQAPWGGYKKSGYGRELGRWGLEEFLGVKQITSCAGSFSYEWYGK